MKTIQETIKFAVKKHQDQFRKGTMLPYIVHPIGVMESLIRYEYDLVTVRAGLLHDTLEDTNTTYEELEKEFGFPVAEIVKKCSENKGNSWKERKQHTIDSIREETDKRVLAVECADKLNNLEAIIKDYKMEGNDFWNRFKADKKSQYWYYKSLCEVFEQKIEKENDLFDAYVKTFNLIENIFK